jgi:hypothetical protein
MEIKVKYPKTETLKKYGLSLDEWKAILDRQDGKCPICKKVPSSGIYRTDHEHAKKWKKMKPEKRKTFVRGLLCVHCNRFYMAKGMNIDKANNMSNYLYSYQLRRYNVKSK